MKNAKYILRLTVILLLITAVTAALLGFTDYITRDKIAALNEQKLQAAMRTVLAADNYRSTELPQDASPLAVQAYEALQGGEIAGYVVEVKPSGFGGEIDMLVGVDTNGAVTGISFVKHSETSGLGAVAAADNAAGSAFREQFVGSAGSVAVTKDGGEIDALTGATVTSRAVSEGVNAALACVDGLG